MSLWKCVWSLMVVIFIILQIKSRKFLTINQTLTFRPPVFCNYDTEVGKPYTKSFTNFSVFWFEDHWWLCRDCGNELTGSWCFRTSYKENKTPINSSDTLFHIIFNKCSCISYIFLTIKYDALHCGLVYVQCEYWTLKENRAVSCVML